MKRKGFTLIELLAVIVILAVIALIATPMIMNVIEESKKGAAKDSAYGYIEAIEWYQVDSEMNSTYQIPRNINVNINNCSEEKCLIDLVKSKGGKPEGMEDYIKLNDKGNIEEGRLTFNKYEVTIENGKVTSVDKVGTVRVEPAIFVIADAVFVVDTEGNLWGWGDNSVGQLGDKAAETQLTPILINDTPKLRSIAMAAIKDKLAIVGLGIDGKIYANYINVTNTGEPDGKFDGNYILIDDPQLLENKFKSITNYYAIDVEGNLYQIMSDVTQVVEGTKFKSISSSSHTMAIDENGNLWAWGENSQGQLGDGTTEDRTNPTMLQIGTKFKSVSVAYDYTIAIDMNDNLWSWGNNGGRNTGLLGDGSGFTSRYTPTKNKEKTKFKSVSSSQDSSMAIDIEGNLWTWGVYNHGQMGIDEYVNHGVPTKLSIPTKFKSVLAEYSCTVAIDSDNNVWTWGQSDEGHLGDGTTERTTPTKIPLNLKRN